MTDYQAECLQSENKKLRELITRLLKVTDDQREAGKKTFPYMKPIWDVKREIAEVLNPVKQRSQSLFEAK